VNEADTPVETGVDTHMEKIAHRWRRVLVVVLAVLTCLSILTSAVGVWAHRTLLNTDSWVKTVGPLASDPAVQKAVATEVSSQIVSAVDLQQIVHENLPRASALVAPLETAVQQFIFSAVEKLMQTQQFQQFWVQANRIAHQLAVKILRGETKGITTSNGVVTIDYLPLIAEALSFIESKSPGFLGTSANVPDITFSTPTDQARSELSKAIGRPLPDNFGVVTVFKSDQLKSAQDAVSLFDKLVVGLLVLTVALLVVTIVLAPRKRRIIIGLALGTVVALGVANAIIAAIKNQIVGLIGDPTTQNAARATVNGLINRLDLILHGLLAVGLAVAIIAFITGDSRLARRTRRGSAKLARSLGGHVDADGLPAPVRWARAHAIELRWGAVALALLALFFLVSGWVGLLVTLVILGLFEAAVTYVASRELPPPTSTPPAAA
jgi:hypothetical protein